MTDQQTPARKKRAPKITMTRAEVLALVAEANADQPEDDAPRELPPMSPVRVLADMSEAVQKLRIQCSNRISAVERLADETPLPPALPRLLLTLRDVERDLTRDMEAALATHPAWPWLRDVRGIGPKLATRIVCDVDIERARTISSLWRFAGYAVMDGQRQRLVKGKTADYNIRLKCSVYLAVASFIKSGARSWYADYYRRQRERYAGREKSEAHPDGWTKGHLHAHAMRKTAKMFLAHLWMAWREAVQLPVSQPWVSGTADAVGHVHEAIVSPWDVLRWESDVQERRAA